MKRLVFLVLLSCLTLATFAQVDSILVKQRRLIANEKMLQRGLDSLQVLLNASRDEYSKSNKDEVASEIIRLENQIYDIRSMLSRVGAQLAQTEALLAKSDYVEDQVQGNVVAGENANLLKNSYFKENVSSKELVLMMTNKDKEIEKLIQQVDQLYKQVVDLKELYLAAQTQEEVNVQMQQAVELKSQIAKLDSEVGRLWGDIYSHKIDNYVVLMDKISVGRDNLELIDQLGREVIQNENALASSIALNSAVLPYQKSLVHGYETVLAQELKLTKAKDSLSKVKINKMNLPKYEDVAFPYRSVVKYGDITIGNDYGYSELADVPELKLPTKGLYFAVQVAYVNGRASALSIFKGAQPLQQEMLPGNKVRYVVGGFRTYEGVLQAVKDCYKFGFKYPVAVAWLDGKFVTLQAAQAYQKANPVEELASGYKVELYAENADIAGRLKGIVDVHAKGKTITRVASGSGFIYTISSFVVPEEAHVFAQILKTDISGARVEVSEVSDPVEE